jgi:hypothetical protein
MSPITLHYDPRLLEQAVFLAQRAGRKAPGLNHERNRIYEALADERERRFEELYRSWFKRLELGTIIERAVQEQPAIASLPGCCFVLYTARTKEEGAELFVDSDGGPEQRRTLRILIRPESLLEPERLLTFLRHELLHIADMLDPAFAYHPDLPASESGPTYDALLRARYTALWDTTINGRMVNRRWLPPSARGEQLVEFALTFPMLEQATERIFESFFSTEPHSHEQFVAFAQNPREALAHASGALQPGSRCPLCGFPSYSFEPAPERMDNFTVAEIMHDFPEWHPGRGLCIQCSDLYRARRISSAAAKLLPGCRVADNMTDPTGGAHHPHEAADDAHTR